MMSSGCNGTSRDREFTRFVIPGATVTYYSGDSRQPAENPSSEQRFPVVDISKGGIGFLADGPPNSKRVSLLVRYSELEEPLRLEGKVVYAMPGGVGVGHRYQIGVELHPFSARKGDNSPETHRALGRLEKMYGIGAAPDSLPGPAVG